MNHRPPQIAAPPSRPTAARFQTKTIEALGAAGLLGLVSATDVGGKGLGLGGGAGRGERVFRDARAALVMAPTTDVLYDFIGKAVCGLPLF